jgi:hypothetical protein
MAKGLFSLAVTLLTLSLTLCAQTITEKTKRHIFKGEINRQGKAVGCHHVNAINQYKTAQLILNTRKNGSNGLFKAKVRVKNEDGRWITKVSNGGYSTFFPEDWSEEKTIEAIKEAYRSKRRVNSELFEGKTKDGITIQFYAKPDGFIASAFPKDWTR